ncbi:hypothetical protein [Neobacillus vireti]|uniref:hypothetical protein n=1 Tax=Neobacillus vireti TaxID=220686 RepID=UPI0030008392
MFKRLVKFFTIGMLAINLAGCQTATIIDLFHAKTEKLQVTEVVFSNPAYEPNRVGTVFFAPYTVQNESDTDPVYYKYSLYLKAFRLVENSNPVTINSVKVKGTKDVTFKELSKDLSIPLEFSDWEGSIQKSDNLLFEEINEENMKLTDDSIITVLVNVSVEENGETITKDLTFELETRSRTYSVQQ